jgi:hypothetical protein
MPPDITVDPPAGERRRLVRGGRSLRRFRSLPFSDRNRLGFDDLKSPVIYIIPHVVPGNVYEECRVIPVCRQISSCALDNKYFKMALDLGDIELQGELEANSLTVDNITDSVL